MKIIKLNIEGVGGIENLEIRPNEGMNILCGPNGIGKTTVLETIAHIFSNGTTNILKRNVNVEKSIIQIIIDNNGKEITHKIEFETFDPETATRIRGIPNKTSALISLKTLRIFAYQALQAVNKDVLKDEGRLSSEAMYGINLNEIKNWFVHRFLYSVHKNVLDEHQLSNFELAKSCFSYLDDQFSFSKVEASSNEIMVNTPTGEIYYEYLSSGFKSVISILFGIIKEIEFRFTAPRINAADYHGIILIDELELHLHPAWQSKISSILSKAFPRAQFFTTTHSPHVIQEANPKEILALESVDGKVSQRELPQSDFGFQGWTIEEVLTDVMGMEDTRTNIFNELMNDFQAHIDRNKYSDASAVFENIDVMLHPHNHLRKLLQFQLAEIKGE